MIQVKVEMVIASEKQLETLELLRSLLGPTRVQAGCLACSLCQSSEDREQVWFSSGWQTREHFERYLKSPRYRSLLIAAELAVAPPVIEIRTMTKSQQLEHTTSVWEGSIQEMPNAESINGI